MKTATSADGTQIAYDADGSGPPLVLVVGALTDRRTVAPFVPLLSDRFTVVRYDRRGRGDSGDTQPYAPERELEDLEAVIAAVRGPVLLFGHSSGAAIALHTARRGAAVRALALYEPPFIVDGARPPLPPDHLERLAALSPGDALEYFLVTGPLVPQAEVDAMKAAPMWEALTGIAHTVLYDNTLMWPEEQGKPLPRAWADEVGDLPVLVLDGDQSGAWIRNAAQELADLLPNARRVTLRGHGHGAPPDVLAPILTSFYEEA